MAEANSLDFAPTLLDYLDVSAPNYFLGTSLFAPEASSYVEYFFTETYVYLSSQEDDIQPPEYEELKEFKTFLKEYFYVKSHFIEKEMHIPSKLHTDSDCICMTVSDGTAYISVLNCIYF